MVLTSKVHHQQLGFTPPSNGSSINTWMPLRRALVPTAKSWTARLTRSVLENSPAVEYHQCDTSQGGLQVAGPAKLTSTILRLPMAVICQARSRRECATDGKLFLRWRIRGGANDTRRPRPRDSRTRPRNLSNGRQKTSPRGSRVGKGATRGSGILSKSTLGRRVDCPIGTSFLPR